MVEKIILFLVLVIAFAAFGHFAYRLYKYLRLAKFENRFDNVGERIKSLLFYGIAQKKVLEDWYGGLLHFLIFWGFVVLLLGIIEIIIAGFVDNFKLPLIGNIYLYSLQDIFTILVIVGVGLAFFRRIILRPERLKEHQGDAIFILCLILFIMFAILGVKGIEILQTNALTSPESAYTPGARFVAQMFYGTPLPALPIWYAIFWWTHLVLILGFLVYLPFSKHLHLLAAIPNAYFRSLKPKGSLSKIDMEDETAESFGVNKIEDFTWKQLLDCYACTECGRCQENCPAYLTEKPLSPKKLIGDLKDHFLEKGKVLISKDEKMKESSVLGKNLIGDVIKEDTIWACTTCRACQEVCPVLNEHIDKTLDMRRYLVLTESKFPKEMSTFFRNMENNSNPWGIGFASRGNWAEGLNLKLLSDDKNVDYLYFAGCAASFDDRNKKIAHAVVKILQAANVNFGILGSEEKCCGETVRRLGNEYVAQMLINENIETFKNYNIKKIITTCPHCFGSLKNEYPDFDGKFEVIHHTEIIHQLLKEGKIKVANKQDGIITYHDSCYLGRYNDIYDIPRDILNQVCVGEIKEMPRNRRKSFCCGAGGGRMWLEENGKRINETRTEEALKINSSIISTACPYCMTMFIDGLKAKNKDEEVQVMDIAEIVAQCME